MILTIKGNVPNKKDQLRPRRKTAGRRGMYYDATVTDALAGIVLQLQAQWKTPNGKQRPPLECASVIVKLFRVSGDFDPDGQLTTILDALKQAKIIVNDTALRVSDSRVIALRVRGGTDELTEVQIYAAEPQWPLPRVPKAKQR